MTKIAHKMAALAAILAVSANVAAAGSYYMPQKPTLQKKMQFQSTAFDCSAQGSPVEFPDDIVVVNKGTATIPAGTTIRWKMVKHGTQGDSVLPVLAPNQHTYIWGALPNGVEAGQKCTVMILSRG